MHTNSIPRTIPIPHEFYSGQFRVTPSFPGDQSSSHVFNYALAPGPQTYSDDPSHSYSQYLSVNRSSSTEPWTALDATGVPHKHPQHPKRSSKAGRGPTTPTRGIDTRSESFVDSGIGRSEGQHYDAVSQLSTSQLEMDEEESWLPLPSQPQDVVTYQQEEVIDLGEDDEPIDEGFEVPSESRSDNRRAPQKEENLTCEKCQISVKTPSDLKYVTSVHMDRSNCLLISYRKHIARHDKEFKCPEADCPRAQNGFATVNDLNRHEKSVHKKDVRKSKSFKCFATNCAKGEKVWPRLDNFKQHITRMHPNDDLEVLVAEAHAWFDRTNPEDPSQSAAVRSALHSQERAAKAPTRKRKPSPTEQQEQPRKKGPALHIPQSTKSTMAPSFLSPNSANSTTPARITPAQNYLQGRPHNFYEVLPNLAGQQASPVRSSGPRMPAQPSRQSPSMVRTQSAVAPNPGRRNTSATSGQYASQANIVTTQNLPWPQLTQTQQQSQLPVPQPASEANYFDLTQYLGDSYQPHRGAHTVADPNDLQGHRVNFMFETDPIMPEAARDSSAFGNDSLFMGVGALTEQQIQASPSTANPPATPEIRIVDEDNVSPLKEYQDVVSQELNSFLREHEAKGKDRGSIMSREEMQQHVRRAIKLSFGSRSGNGSSSGPDRGTNYVGPLYCPVKGKTHVECPVCGIIKLRQSELNKHLKRHSRPYGCVLDNCYKNFGSKNDWKRHEQVHPEQKECFRCDGHHIDIKTRRPCQRVFYNGKPAYCQHLGQSGISANQHETVAEECRIRGNNQMRFWCGFCRKIVHHGLTGTDALNERLRHIDNHFQTQKKKVADWIELGGEGRTKSQVQREQNEAKMQQACASKGKSVATSDQTEDSQASQTSSTSSSPEEQSRGEPEQGQHITPQRSQQHRQGLSRQLSSSSQGQQQLTQPAMWRNNPVSPSMQQHLQFQNQQQRQQQQQPRNFARTQQPQQQLRQQHMHQPPQRSQNQTTPRGRYNRYQDPSAARLQGRAEYATCCRCEEPFSLALGRRCINMDCQHDFCNMCGKQ